MANRAAKWGQSVSAINIRSSYSTGLAPEYEEYRPLTRQEYSPPKVFTPGNAQIFPMNGTINRKVYKVPQETLNLFYIDSIRQGIRDGLIVIGETKPKAPNPITETIPAESGDISLLKNLSPASIKELPGCQVDPDMVPVHTLVTYLNMSPSESASDEDEDEDDEINNDTILRTSAPFYYKENESDGPKLGPRSRKSLAEARRQFFEPLYNHIEDTVKE